MNWPNWIVASFWLLSISLKRYFPSSFFWREKVHTCQQSVTILGIVFRYICSFRLLLAWTKKENISRLHYYYCFKTFARSSPKERFFLLSFFFFENGSLFSSVHCVSKIWWNNQLMMPIIKRTFFQSKYFGSKLPNKKKIFFTLTAAIFVHTCMVKTMP